jgi:hypothetical protein
MTVTVTTTNKDQTTIRATSLASLAQWIKATPRAKDARYASKSETPSQDWDLGTGFEGAMDLLSAGGFWPEGATKMVREAQTMRDIIRQTPFPQVVRHYHGSSPAMAAFMRGDPRNMRKQKPLPMPSKPILRIAIALNASAVIDANDIVNRGAAWLTIIESLESQGYRCEVDAVALITTEDQMEERDQSKAIWSDLRVRIKDADQPFNPNQLAFMTAHPAANRRIAFAVRERVDHWAFITQESYGAVAAHPNRVARLAKEYDIYSEPLVWAQKSQFASATSALGTIRRLVNDQLEKLDALG